MTQALQGFLDATQGYNPNPAKPKPVLMYWSQLHTAFSPSVLKQFCSFLYLVTTFWYFFCSSWSNGPKFITVAVLSKPPALIQSPLFFLLHSSSFLSALLRSWLFCFWRAMLTPLRQCVFPNPAGEAGPFSRFGSVLHTHLPLLSGLLTSKAFVILALIPPLTGVVQEGAMVFQVHSLGEGS